MDKITALLKEARIEADENRSKDVRHFAASVVEVVEELIQQLQDAEESNKAVERALKDVDYRGSYADGVMYLKGQLAAAKFHEKSLINTAKVNREGWQKQLAAMTKERDEIAAQARMLDRMVDERDGQLAAALAACDAKDTILRGITLYRAFNGDDWPAIEATQALAIKPDSSALKAHDAALIERCAEVCEEHQGSAETCAAAIRELKSQL